jgi:hypothetical protein
VVRGRATLVATANDPGAFADRLACLGVGSVFVDEENLSADLVKHLAA